jgi:hypothetical protein
LLSARAFSSVLGALAVFVSFICSFISFEIHWRYFFSIARACSAALTTLGVLLVHLKRIVPSTAASTPLPPCLLA